MMNTHKKFFNKNATQSVPLLKVLYLVSIPLAEVLIKLGLSPHAITSISNLCALVSFFFIKDNPLAFGFLWFMALIFDICDGIVARKTNSSSATGSFYDHISDVAKILVLFGVIGLTYDSYIISLASLVNIVLFSLLAYSNMIQSQRRLILKFNVEHKTEEKSEEVDVSNKSDSLLKQIVKSNEWFKNFLLGTYSSIFVIYGNFNLLIIPAAFGERVALLTLLLTGIVVFKSLTSVIKNVLLLNKELARKNIHWK